MNLEAYKRWMLEEFQPAATTSSSAH